MRILKTLLVAACAAFVPFAAFAHGPQLQINAEEGKIVTRQIFANPPYQPLTDPVSAYVMPVMPYNGSWYSRPNDDVDALGLPAFFSGPGLAYGLGQTFAVGESFTLQFTDGLKWWDGAAFMDAGDVQLEAFRGTPETPAAVAATTDVGPFAGLGFDPIAVDYNDEAHSAARFRLLGDGVDPTSSVADGVFLASLQLTSTQADLASSDEFYFVLHKNASPESTAAAVDSLGLAPGAVQVIPEPSAWLLAAFAATCAGLVVRSRRS